MQGLKRTLLAVGIFMVFCLVGLLGAEPAEARGIYLNSTSFAYGGPIYQIGPYYPVYGAYPEVYRRPYRGQVGPPLRGSNDAMYERDNIYGPGASAAGRMSHFTKNVPPYGHIY